MIFNFHLDGRTYEMDLPPELRVAIARHLINLHNEYCKANPSENISLEDYLTLVEKSPHPENEAARANESEYLEEFVDEDELIRLGAESEKARRKDLMIDVLLEAIAKLK